MYSRERLDSSLQKMYTAVRSSVAKSAEQSPTEFTIDPFLLFYDFNTQQQEDYQERVIELLNEIFKKSNLMEIPNDFMKAYRRGILSTLGSRGSFTALFKKNEEPKEQRMTFPCSLIETVQTASVEVPNTYEFYRVPIIIYELTNYYDQELIKSHGIFRACGNIKRIDSLLQEFQKPPGYGKGCLDPQYNPFDVSDTLKRYLRSLPEPVMTRKLHPYFIQCIDIFDTEDRIHAIQLLILLLPVEHSITLTYLLQFFHKVAQAAGSNQMNIDNLGKILGPCLTWSSNDDKAVRDYADSVKVISFMIAKYECFEVHRTPAKMLLKPFREQSKRKVKSIRPSSMLPTNPYVPLVAPNVVKKRNKSVDYTPSILGTAENEFTLPELYVGSPLAKIFDSLSTDFD